jgi:hypothetical protein
MAESKNNVDLHVLVKFGKGVPIEIQGVALLDFERKLRTLMSGAIVEVFKETKGDDSKLRSAMTPEQRAKL